MSLIFQVLLCLSLGWTAVFTFLFLRTYIKYSRKSRQPTTPQPPSPPSPPPPRPPYRELSKEEKIKEFKKIMKEMEEMRKELEKEGFTSTRDMTQMEMLFLLRDLRDQVRGMNDQVRGLSDQMRGLSNQVTDFRSEMRALLLFGIALIIGIIISFGATILSAFWQL